MIQSKKGEMNMLRLMGIFFAPGLIALFITLVTSGTADDMMAYFLINLIMFVLVGLAITEGNKVRNKPQRDQMIKQQKKQEKYDNDWGVIEYK